jgi:hypothetical protein
MRGAQPQRHGARHDGPALPMLASAKKYDTALQMQSTSAVGNKLIGPETEKTASHRIGG